MYEVSGAGKAQNKKLCITAGSLMSLFSQIYRLTAGSSSQQVKKGKCGFTSKEWFQSSFVGLGIKQF